MEQPQIKALKERYNTEKAKLQARLNQFKALPEENQLKELLFCTLTPQSKAQRCWEAIELISSLKKPKRSKITEILRTRTRFHNNKTNYLLEAKSSWNNLKPLLKNQNIRELRNKLAETIKGYGLKEASHFLRNIGKSNNQIAILDRHILKNLKSLGVIENDKIKSKKDYLAKEERYIEFSKKIEIPADELDLLWWSQENGELFK